MDPLLRMGFQDFLNRPAPGRVRIPTRLESRPVTDPSDLVQKVAEIRIRLLVDETGKSHPDLGRIVASQ